MHSDIWGAVLIVTLAGNAAMGFGYRVFRLTKGGPMSDVIGQGILAALLLCTALLVALEVAWARWVALGYGLLFGIVVMPAWVLAVLLPMRPERIDYSFTIAYWTDLVVIVIAALAL